MQSDPDATGTNHRPAVRRRSGSVAGFVTISAAAIGVLVTLVAVTTTPDEPTEPIASPTFASSPKTTTAIVSTPAVRSFPGPTIVTLPPTASVPPGTVVILDPPTSSPGSKVDDGTWSGSTTAVAAFDRLKTRLVRRLGPSNRGIPDRVAVSQDDETLMVTWALNAPTATGEDAGPGDDARNDVMRRELRRVVRVLAALELPQRFSDIDVRATFIHRGDEDAERVVLDASFAAATLDALEADDVRLGDATLAELLGLAIVVVGDETWGVAEVHPPAPGVDDAPSTALTTTLPSPR